MFVCVGPPDALSLAFDHRLRNSRQQSKVRHGLVWPRELMCWHIDQIMSKGDPLENSIFSLHRDVIRLSWKSTYVKLCGRPRPLASQPSFTAQSRDGCLAGDQMQFQQGVPSQWGTLGDSPPPHWTWHGQIGQEVCVVAWGDVAGATVSTDNWGLAPVLFSSHLVCHHDLCDHNNSHRSYVDLGCRGGEPLPRSTDCNTSL